MSGPPNCLQKQFAELSLCNVLLIAPAGCGKTEALAYRAKSIIQRGDVKHPRKLLAVTFSNKAKENLSSRMSAHIGRNWRQIVTVTNFHGLAARIIKNHGAVVGLRRDTLLPDKRWRGERLKELGIGYKDGPIFERILREAKRDGADDEQVLNRIKDSGFDVAVEFEKELQRENRLDYDDLLRHAQRILSNRQVANLYASHFVTAMVDEVQDLSLRHLGLVNAVVGGCVTYAGDSAQGIYSFAGAEPDKVFEAIQSRNPIKCTLNVSYRSSPAVLRAVNIFSRMMGNQELQCGNPNRWLDGGHVLLVKSENTLKEASELISFAHEKTDGVTSVGLVARRSKRLDDIRRVAEERKVEFTDWGSPTHIPRVVELLNRHLRVAEAMEGDPIQSLEDLCKAEVDASDVDTYSEIASACGVLQEIVDRGATVAEAVAKCRATPAQNQPVPPGVHLLTGHLGKGQEFDWVVVVGLEKGHIPDFRNTQQPELADEFRVFHVMVSRARYGVVLTNARKVNTRLGWRNVEASEWLSFLTPVITGYRSEKTSVR